MYFPKLTDPSGACISIHPARVIDIKPYGYNGAEPLPAPNGVQTKIVWLHPAAGDGGAFVTQTFCRESVAAVITMFNGDDEPRE